MNGTMNKESSGGSLKRKRKIFAWIFVASFFVFLGSNVFWNLSPLPSPTSTINDSKQNNSVHRPDECSGPWQKRPLICEELNNNQGNTSEPPVLSAPSSVSLNLEGAVYISVISLLTSLTSLVGFLSTTVLAWRKEKRETLAAEIELQKKELELEKLRMEIQKSGNHNGDESA